MLTEVIATFLYKRENMKSSIIINFQHFMQIYALQYRSYYKVEKIE